MTGKHKLGKAIRLLRHQNDWSQGEVAEKIGMSIPAYSKIECGVTDLNLSRLREIATAFKLTDVELLTLQNQIDLEKTDKLDVPGRHLILQEAYKLLTVKERQMMDLQKKVIELFELLNIEKFKDK